MLVDSMTTAQRVHALRQHCPLERERGVNSGAVEGLVVTAQAATCRGTDKRCEHNLIWKSCWTLWWTPVYVRKDYIFKCVQIHQHVKSVLYLCTLLIVQSVFDFQSLIKLLYAVLVIAKYFTFKNTGFHY
jgi:hypothetical protein